MRITLVEPFHGGSHQAWAEGYAAHSTHEVQLVTHPGERWRWRLQGGALTLAEDLNTLVAEHGPPDVLVVSDMVHVPALLGFSRRHLGAVPVVVYFHESQLLHPVRDARPPDRDLVVANWLSMAAADLVVFNSSYHRDALAAALPSFLREVGDPRHGDRLDDVLARAEVLPVGVDLGDLRPDEQTPDEATVPTVLWNHRWDWDKRIDDALRMLVDVAEQGVAFDLVLAGERPGPASPKIKALLATLDDRIRVNAHLPRADYVAAVRDSDVVLSTAVHEFFGVAMVEAMAAGCVPVLPADLSYPEIVPEGWHGDALYERVPGAGVERLAEVLANPASARANVAGLAESMRRFDWSVVAPLYDARMERLVAI
jgi:glycosyltransferase involved in cell wall biosynthesis